MRAWMGVIHTDGGLRRVCQLGSRGGQALNVTSVFHVACRRTLLGQSQARLCRCTSRIQSWAIRSNWELMCEDFWSALDPFFFCLKSLSFLFYSTTLLTYPLFSLYFGSLSLPFSLPFFSVWYSSSWTLSLLSDILSIWSFLLYISLTVGRMFIHKEILPFWPSTDNATVFF